MFCFCLYLSQSFSINKSLKLDLITLSFKTPPMVFPSPSTGKAKILIMAYKVLKDLVPFADLIDYYTSTHPVMESPSQVGFRDHPTRITILPIATQPLHSFPVLFYFSLYLLPLTYFVFYSYISLFFSLLPSSCKLSPVSSMKAGIFVSFAI